MRKVLLRTPPLPLLVPAETFDGFNWSPSEALEWRAMEAPLEVNDFDGDLPLRMVFVFREPWDVLPAELARLHAGRAMTAALGLRDEMALAPYAIDDATDALYAHRRRPEDTFWLATDNLNALFWALHDWAHYHNHGPFTDRPSTELQCDTAALAWLWLNREVIPLDARDWERVRAGVLENHMKLRAQESATRCPPPDVLRSGERIREIAAGCAG
jgi:hypothetical protein